MSTRDGGPAFPTGFAFNAGAPGEYHETYMGMTLRDWFAGQALAGMALMIDPNLSTRVDAVASAFSYADAMLEAREEKA